MGGGSKKSLFDMAFDKTVNVETSKQIAVGYKSAQQHSSTAQQHSSTATRDASGNLRLRVNAVGWSG